MLFKNILVPYDGSQLSEEALKLALEIAKMTGNSKVSLLNVIKEIPLPPSRFNMNSILQKQAKTFQQRHILKNCTEICSQI